MAAQYLPAFVIGYSDSSFTNPHQVALPDDPPDCKGDFTHMGAKYWGFETERHRATRVFPDRQQLQYDHHAYHFLKLGLINPAIITSINVSTKWFTGNQVPEIAIEVLSSSGWKEVVPRSPLQPDSEHTFEITPTAGRECLIKCYHEGGISRVQLFGEPDTNRSSNSESERNSNLLEKAEITHVSNEHYGKPADAVAGNRQVDYMLGWESARSGFGEQALFHLDAAYTIDEIIVDTYMHRLNPPLTCHVFGLMEPDPTKVDAHMRVKPAFGITFENGKHVLPTNFAAYMSAREFLNEDVRNSGRFNIALEVPQNSAWQPLVSFAQLQADTWHKFDTIETSAPVNHILYIHYPNGGIHGLKVFGTQQ